MLRSETFILEYSLFPSSPNAEEAFSILSLPQPVTKDQIEFAASRFLEIGVGPAGDGTVLIRSGALGAYVATRKHGGRWVDAYWGTEDARKVVDVTGKMDILLFATMLTASSDMLTRCW